MACILSFRSFGRQKVSAARGRSPWRAEPAIDYRLATRRPRIGAAWDVFEDGRMKYSAATVSFYDIMKLNLAISSFGASTGKLRVRLNTSDLSTINPLLMASTDRYCVGRNRPHRGQFPGWNSAAGLTFHRNTISGRSRRLFNCSATQEGRRTGLKAHNSMSHVRIDKINEKI